MATVEERLQDMTSEILFLGTIYKYPTMYPKYARYLSQQDFSVGASQFFYTLFTEVYDRYSKTPDEKSIGGYLVSRKRALAKFNEYGGFSTVKNFMEGCNSNDISMYFDNIKKYSLMREYYDKGFPVLDILDGRYDKATKKKIEFKDLKAKHISRILLNRVAKIYTKLKNTEDMQDLTEDCTQYVLEKLDRPQMGIPFPYPIMSELFSGFRKNQFMAWGMLSNAGKSRFLMKIIAYLAFIQNQKVLLLANEMTYEEMKECMITTVLDNYEFQQQHGFEQRKPQREIVNGIYRDKNNNIIEREYNEAGQPAMSTKDFIKLLKKESPDFNLVMNAVGWIEKNFKDRLYIIDLGEDYSDGALKELIENAKNVDGINYVFYDTFKADREASGDWSKLKNTATMLKELAKELDIFIGANIQLTDDAINVPPMLLSSLNIANCKQIKHVMDGLCLFKEIPRDTYSQYRYKAFLIDMETGELVETDDLKLNENKRYYICKIDKNRSGEKPNLLFELDLNLNTWFECGIVYTVSSKDKKDSKTARTNDYQERQKALRKREGNRI